MSSFNKSKLQSFLLSFLLSVFTIIVIYLFSAYGTNNDMFLINSVVELLILIIILFTLYFFIIYFYLESFVLKKIKNLYKDLVSNQETEQSVLVSTNMDELVEQLKIFSKESETEIKSMQQKENFRRDFIGNLAHELKTPLFTSQSYLLTLIDGALKDEKVNLKYLKIAEKSIERLIFIVKDLDLITKLESDDLKLEKSTFNIISLVNNVFEMLEIQSSIKKYLFL